MEKLAAYEQAILDILNEYASYIPIGMQEPKNQVIADSEKHHYLMLRTGWDDEVFLHHVVMHFDIKAGKIWIQANNTELDVGKELTDRGVAAADIVVGFQPEKYRAYTGYAVR